MLDLQINDDKDESVHEVTVLIVQTVILLLLSYSGSNIVILMKFTLNIHSDGVIVLLRCS